MIWQDVIIGGVGWAFTAALLPMLRKSAPSAPMSTALLNAGLLVVLAVTVATLGARGGAVAMLITAGCWARIAWMSWRMR
jgi:hypothetical protein